MKETAESISKEPMWGLQTPSYSRPYFLDQSALGARTPFPEEGSPLQTYESCPSVGVQGKPGLVLGREHGLLGAWQVYPILSQERRVSPRAVSSGEWEEASLALWPLAELGWPLVPSLVCSPSVP